MRTDIWTKKDQILNAKLEELISLGSQKSLRRRMKVTP